MPEHSEAAVKAVASAIAETARDLLSRGITVDEVMHGLAVALGMACQQTSDDPRALLNSLTAFAAEVIAVPPDTNPVRLTH